MPVSLRAAEDTATDIQAMLTLVSLATHLADPLQRLPAVRAAAGAAKDWTTRAWSIIPTDFPSLGIPWIVGGLASLYGRSGLAKALPPLANLAISNVPGPHQALCFAGGRIRACWPLSIVEHGLGLTFAATAVQDVHVLARALAAAYDELQQLPAAEPQSAHVRRPAARCEVSEQSFQVIRFDNRDAGFSTHIGIGCCSSLRSSVVPVFPPTRSSCAGSWCGPLRVRTIRADNAGSCWRSLPPVTGIANWHESALRHWSSMVPTTRCCRRQRDAIRRNRLSVPDCRSSRGWGTICRRECRRGCWKRSSSTVGQLQRQVFDRQRLVEQITLTGMATVRFEKLALRPGFHALGRVNEENAMSYPEFFDSVPRLRMRDPLAAFLGAVEDGVIEYGYIDAVKLAGHSCPTVASAYWLTCRALGTLYRGELPERGGIRVEFREDRTFGVTGVMANIVSLLTGATSDTGFKGLAGRFDRRNLLLFNVDLQLDMRFTRTDTGAHVDAAADVRQIPSDPAMALLLQRSLSGQVGSEEQRRFGAIWQDRVRRTLLDHGQDGKVFVIHCPAGDTATAPRNDGECARGESIAQYSSPPCYAHEFSGYFGEDEAGDC